MSGVGCKVESVGCKGRDTRHAEAEQTIGNTRMLFGIQEERGIEISREKLREYDRY